jgi:hypothetical protein
MPGAPQTGPVILHILMWSTLLLGLIAVMVVLLLNG